MARNSEGGLHRRLTLNSISNLARYLLWTGIAIFLTPFIIRTLGDSLYGFWITLASFIGYASLLEFGVQPAVVKLVGQYRGAGDEEKLQELVTTALAFFLVVGLVAGLACTLVIPIWATRFVEDLRGIDHSLLLFVAIGAEALVSYMNYLVTGVLYGDQRYHVKNLIDSCGWLINAVLIWIFLPTGGLLAIVLAKLLSDTLIVIAGAVALHRALPTLRIDPGLIRRSSFGELMGFGGRVFVSATTTRLATYAQPLIISTALSAAATAIYAIPVKLMDYARQLGWTLTASFMPMFSELQGRKETELLRKVYVDYTRYLFTLLVPIAILLMVYGSPFIGLWIGPEYQERGHVITLLMATSVLLDMFQPLLWRFFVGVGELNYLVKISAGSSILSVILGIVLVKPFGVEGVAAGLLFCGVLVHGANAVYSSRYLQISVLEFFLRAHARTVVAALALSITAVLMSLFLGTSSYWRMFVGCLASIAVYAPLAIRLGLTESERRTLLLRVNERLPWKRPTSVGIEVEGESS
jgi:O-antigen/teichoic acid export membrane protein